MTNTLVIFLDDARADALTFMPTIRELAERRGVVFKSAWSQTPVCMPSRAGILWGQHGLRTQIITNSIPQYEDAIANDRWSHVNLGQWLTSADVDTCILGKYHSDVVAPPAHVGWSRARIITPQQNHLNADIVHEDGSIEQLGGRWHSRYCADQAIEHINESSGDWSIYWPTSSPHWPFGVEPDLNWLFWTEGRGNYFPQHGVNWPAWNYNESELTPTLWNQARDIIRQQARELYDIDRQFSRILEHVDLSETVVIVTSDNGLHVGDHRLMGGGTKNTLYTPASNIPMVMFGGGEEMGGRNDTIVSLLDVTATILAIHEAEAPHTLDGSDLRTFVNNPDLSRTTVLARQPPTGGEARPPAIGLVTQSHKLIVNDHPDTGTVVELYNLIDDPGEIVNLSGVPGVSEIESELMDILSDAYEYYTE